MKAVIMDSTGDAGVLHLGEFPDPPLGNKDVLVQVKATALNRADLLQRRGMYPPPAGASPILGLEMAGEIIKIGRDVVGWMPGDRVCALLPGGGYAAQASVPADMLMKLPDQISYEEGTAIPEVFLTAYMNLVWLGGLSAEQTVLVHAGASGVGTAAIQIIREMGSRSIITAGSSGKIEACISLGADKGWNYHDGSFADWVSEQTDGQGVNIILDFIGAPYFDDNLKSLTIGGKLIVIGTMGGAQTDGLHLGLLLSKRLQIIGTALRTRSLADKVRLTAEFSSFALPYFSTGRMKPIVDRVFDWSEVSSAHRYMESNANTGKIVLRVNG